MAFIGWKLDVGVETWRANAPRMVLPVKSGSGLPVSAAIREMIGGVTIRQRPPQELHDLYVEINHIGNNINQIARKANAGFATKEDVRELKFLMRTIETKMTELVKQ